MKNKYLYIDFEYNQSQERHPHLVCVAWQNSKAPDIKSKRWLHNDKEEQEHLANVLTMYNKQGYIMVAYAVTAEARCFHALGLDPTEFKWHDLYLEWRQLQNCYDKYKYGTYFAMGKKYKSHPPTWSGPKKDNNPISLGLVGCIAYWMEKDVNKGLKDTMRDLILECKPEYTPEEQESILEYCASDIKYLPELKTKMNGALWKELGKPDLEKFYQWQRNRSEFAALAALMESEGLPLHMPSIKNLRRNVALAKDKLITDLVNNHYPFFVKHKSRVRELQGSWKADRKKFTEFVEIHPSTVNIRKTWKKTESDSYSTEDQYLKTFDNIPEIKAFRETNKLLNQLKWLREPEPGDPDLFKNIGSDGRLRTHFGIYGTQTARNAPAAKRFIFAMSAWLRCLVRPPEGWIIVELDYASQEFAIAAILSKDPNMLDAYESGDPYLYFAKKAKAVPENGTKEKYKEERDLFKATTLGLQYGMGAKSLAIKLTADMGKEVTEIEAKKLIELHRKVYARYWRWLNDLDKKYKKKNFLQLPCGWALFRDNFSALSVRNFPTQGGGSSIIREAVAGLKEMNIKTIATLHDACYIMVPAGEKGPKQIQGAKAFLRQAFNSVLNQTSLKIRIDVNIHKSHEPWVSEKGKKFYYLLKEYLEPKITRNDRIENLMSTVFK